MAERNTNIIEPYFGGSKQYIDKESGLTIVNVHAGDCFVSSQKGFIAATVLGSCISACVRDPIANVAGMNHFLLPGREGETLTSARFGAYAMEQLINEILKRGGRRERLEVKLFGGGNVMNHANKIGDQNANFALQYANAENLNIITQDVGGIYPRKVRFYLDDGKVLMRKLRRKDDYQQVRIEESSYRSTLEKTDSAPSQGGDIELF